MWIFDRFLGSSKSLSQVGRIDDLPSLLSPAYDRAGLKKM
jgi:hypothetical protein